MLAVAVATLLGPDRGQATTADGDSGFNRIRRCRCSGCECCVRHAYRTAKQSRRQLGSSVVLAAAAIGERGDGLLAGASGLEILDPLLGKLATWRKLGGVAEGGSRQHQPLGLLVQRDAQRHVRRAGLGTHRDRLLQRLDGARVFLAIQMQLSELQVQIGRRCCANRLGQCGGSQAALRGLQSTTPPATAGWPPTSSAFRCRANPSAASRRRRGAPICAVRPTSCSRCSSVAM